MPDLRVTAVDLPAVVPSTHRAVAAAGHADRYTVVAADLFTVELPAPGFDLVLLGNLCHLFDEPTNRRLLDRAAGWLSPGGRVAVVDIVSDGERRPATTALYALNLLGRTVSGGVRPAATHRR